MLPAGQFGDDAAKGAVLDILIGGNLRAHETITVDDGDGGVITTGFEA